MADEQRSVWFLTGSQGLYGEEVLRQVADQSRRIADALDDAEEIPVPGRRKPVLTAADAIRRTLLDANADDALRRRDRVDAHLLARRRCGSPGSTRCASRCCTCTPRPTSSCPGPSIDMDFMNLNQAAHGDREFGYIQSRLGVARKTVAGHVSDPRGPGPHRRAGCGRRSAATRCGTLRLARFGDNMRDVAVTEGDKVEAELRFGVSVNTYGVNDLVAGVDAVPDADVDDAGDGSTSTSTTSPPSCARRRPARVAALRRAHRAGPARLPRRRRLHRLHHQLRGPRRAAAAARPGRAAADGRRLRLRRRGRLEDVRCCCAR